MTQPRNIVGQQLRRIREQRGLTQPDVVAKCNLIGWQISRESYAKIESRIRWVADFELVCLAKALKLPAESLLPSGDSLKAVKPLLKSG